MMIYSISYQRTIASFKESSPLSAIQCFLLEIPVSSLFFNAIPQLLTSSTSCFPLLSFLQSRVIESSSYVICDQTNQSSFILFYTGCSFIFLTLYNTSLFFTRSMQVLFSSTTFYNSQGISDLRSEVPKFQHRASCALNVAFHQFLP